MNPLLLRHLKKTLVLIIGGTVLLVGIVLIFLPGPSFIVIPAGLAILAIEFSWARNLFKKVQNRTGNKLSRWIPRKWRAEDPQDRSVDYNADSKKS